MKNTRINGITLLWLLPGAFIFSRILPLMTKEKCRQRLLALDTDFVNDVILEFEKFGFACAANFSLDKSCSYKTNVNETRIVANGKVVVHTDASIPQKVVEEHKKTEENYSNRGPKLLFDRIDSISKGPRLKLLNCDEIDKLFYPANSRAEETNGDSTIVYGTLDHPINGKTSCILKTAKRSDEEHYRLLEVERAKRLVFGTDTRISNRMLGECYKSDSLKIVVEKAETSMDLCDEEPATASYSQTKCYRNEKLLNMIEKSQDKTRSSFVFVKELLCLLAELESKRIFIQDIHGKHLAVTSNFSVFFKDVDVLSHHGSRNILSGGACKYDENCPEPNGTLWNNGSANRVLYAKCMDTKPYCHETSCAGYNSSLHICGIARWILQPLYQNFERIQDRSRLTSIIMSSMNSWSFLRSSAMDSCKKAIVYYQLYEKDMDRIRQSNGPARKFHLKAQKPA